jgi:hypothetical protein
VLIDDSFNLGKAEYINQTVFLDIVKYLVNETSSMPFEAALSGMYFVEDMISTDFESIQLFKVILLDLFLIAECLGKESAPFESFFNA